MVAVGEEAGTLDRALFKIADTYEREADRAMKLMTSLVEPAMILVMGSLVGFIVISMLLPIFQIDLLAR
jgi:type II secretory pathway component PulF